MKTLILSTYDTAGGAARASLRLHQGLRNKGIDSQMLVQTKFGDNTTVSEANTPKSKLLAKTGHALDALPTTFYRHRQSTEFSTQWVPDATVKPIQKINPDIINLHWVNESFVKIESLRNLKQPVVWTLHDMWVFTGGCHYDQECKKYIDSCGQCPQLGSSSRNDLSSWIWQRKYKAWHNLDLTIVTPSAWMAQCAQESRLLKNTRIEVIPNGIDTELYKPIDQKLARHLLNLPQDKKLLLFGAVNATSSPRKGFLLLQQALKSLHKSGSCQDLELLVLGSSKPQSDQSLEFNSHYLGKLSDDVSLALVYSAADLFVAPSTQDNLPNTVVESLSCGVPCVAFKIGGMAEMIEHKINGYLSTPFDTEDLAKGVKWVLEDSERYAALKKCSRETAVSKFSYEIQANSYASLFEDLIQK